MGTSLDERKLVTGFAADNNHVGQLNFINEDPAGVTIEPLSGRLANYCYRVASKDHEHSVVLKYGEETMKSLNKEKVSLDRQRVEYNCLTFLHSLIPGKVPQPYCIDTSHSIIAMEDLRDWDHFGDHLQNSGPDLNVASELGSVAGRMHWATSKQNVNPEYWEELGRFRQPKMKARIRDFFWHRYFVAAEKSPHLSDSVKKPFRKYCKEFLGSELQSKIQGLYDEERCLIQVDSHWKSVFVKGGHIVMFDFEVVTLGHPGVTLGYYVVSFFVCFLVRMANLGIVPCGKDAKDLKEQFQNAVVCMLTTYVEEVGDQNEDITLTFMSELALFSGALMAFWSVFDEASDFDPAITADIRVSLMHRGFRVMRSHTSIKTIEQMAKAVFNQE